VTEVFGPWLFDGSEFVEGGVVVSRGKVVEVLTAPPEDVTSRCLVLPLLANAHTHIGDAFIRRVPKGSIEDIVAPPDGFKFRMLRKTPGETIISGMRGAIKEMASSGVERFADFRENGLCGVETLKMALKGQKTRAVILGRPSDLRYNEKEAASILEKADGIGLSSISEWGRRDLEALSEQTRRAKKVFAIHASERGREPFAEVASLEPDFVVHMLKASRKDFRLCADAIIPVVACPRSNAFFGLRPPVRKMLDAGIAVALGTDNAMLAHPDILGEARFLARTQKELTPKEVVQTAVAGGRKVLNLEPGFRMKRRAPARFAAVECGAGDPYKAFLDPRNKLVAVRAEG